MPNQARADDLADFEAARSLYDQQSYARAVDAFRLLVGSEPPRLTDPLLVLESRKYLAASLLFMGAEAEARAQFRLLLQQEPSYALDPLAFPTEVFTQFEQVKQALREEVAERLRAEQDAILRAQRAVREAERQRAENLARLRSLASTGESRERNSRWIATVPFGVGQFQNGDKGLGVALGMLEGLAAISSVVSYVAHERLPTRTLAPRTYVQRSRSSPLGAPPTSHPSACSWRWPSSASSTPTCVSCLSASTTSRASCLPISTAGFASRTRACPRLPAFLFCASSRAAPELDRAPVAYTPKGRETTGRSGNSEPAV